MVTIGLTHTYLLTQKNIFSRYPWWVRGRHSLRSLIQQPLSLETSSHKTFDESSIKGYFLPNLNLNLLVFFTETGNRESLQQDVTKTIGRVTSWIGDRDVASDVCSSSQHLRASDKPRRRFLATNRKRDLKLRKRRGEEDFGRSENVLSFYRVRLQP